MFKRSAKEVAEITGSIVCAGDSAVLCSNFLVDSRAVTPESSFVCFKGEKTDGNKYALQALDLGASLVVMTREPTSDEVDAAKTKGACIIRANDDNAEAFLLNLATFYRLEHTWSVIGITGSVGKTTTKDFLAAALSTKYKVHKNKGNLNSVIGVPMTILSAPNDTEVLVCEMGMNFPGEIDKIAACVRPHAALVTNIGTSHIGNLGSRDNIAYAKAECIPWISRDKNMVKCIDFEPFVAIPKSDDYADYFKECATANGINCIFSGSGKDLIHAENIKLQTNGCASFDASCAGEKIHALLSIPGEHLVSNALLATLAAIKCGVSLEDALGAISKVKSGEMRMNIITSDKGYNIIDDSYNSSPASLAAALNLMCSIPCEGNRIAVIGEVGELGDASSYLHSLMGAFIAAKELDFVLFVGADGAATMMDSASAMGMSADKMHYCTDSAAASLFVKSLLKCGDLLLLKGSRFIGLDSIVKEVK